MRWIIVSIAAVYLCGVVAWVVDPPPHQRRIVASASAPSHAQPLLSTALSFSIEQDKWPEWVGVDVRNEFTHVALTNLQSFTGSPPKIRVGANSADRTTWAPNNFSIVTAWFPPATNITPYPEASKILVGDRYYQLSSNLPAGTHMTWGINLAADDPVNAVNMAKSIMMAFSSSDVQNADVHLDLLEVGNEPDLYKKHRIRPANWTVQNYVNDWIKIASAVVDGIGLNNLGNVKIQGASFAGQGFTPTEILNLGILRSKPGNLISQISQHRYSGFFCSGGNFALSSFMSKSSVRGNLTVFNADIAEVTKNGLPYVLGETGSIACHGAPGVSNTAGAALWVIDYTLQAVTLGISEVYFHEGIGYKYNFIQPVSLSHSILDGSPLNPPQEPHIQPSYYAAILIARAIGNTGSARIVEIPIPDDHVSGYVIFEGDTIVRAVFVNLHAWLRSSTGSRPSVHLEFDKLPLNKTVSVRRLQIQYADDTEGLTLGGQSYETSDARVSGSEVLETIVVSQGLDLQSTEAALLSF